MLIIPHSLALTISTTICFVMMLLMVIQWWGYRQRLAIVEGQKDAEHAERNKLVALVASLYPSWLGRHPHTDATWEDDWRTIVIVQLPDAGQVSWHIHDSEIERFAFLDKQTGADYQWDSLTSIEKYRRVSRQVLTNVAKGSV